MSKKDIIFGCTVKVNNGFYKDTEGTVVDKVYDFLPRVSNYRTYYKVMVKHPLVLLSHITLNLLEDEFEVI